MVRYREERADFFFGFALSASLAASCWPTYAEEDYKTVSTPSNTSFQEFTAISPMISQYLILMSTTCIETAGKDVTQFVLRLFILSYALDHGHVLTTLL